MKTEYIVTHGLSSAGQSARHLRSESLCTFCSRRRVLKVLKLSAQGLPQSWISLEQAVIHYAAGEVRWGSGGHIARFRGGHNAITGEQSVISINSIIGTKGVPSINPFELKPSLTNSKLFARDRNVCAYCGGHFHEEDLTREHIVPFARNGQDHWMNVVTACSSEIHDWGSPWAESFKTFKTRLLDHKVHKDMTSAKQDSGK